MIPQKQTIDNLKFKKLVTGKNLKLIFYLPKAPEKNPRWKELYMKTGALAIIKKSHIAKFTTKTLEGWKNEKIISRVQEA